MIVDALSLLKSKLSSKLNSSDKRAYIQDSDFVVALIQAVAGAKNKFTQKSFSTTLGVMFFLAAVSLKSSLRSSLVDLTIWSMILFLTDFSDDLEYPSSRRLSVFQELFPKFWV
jgi:hypothetical protein